MEGDGRLTSGNLSELTAEDDDDNPYGGFKVPALQAFIERDDVDKLFSLDRRDRAHAISFIETDVTPENYGELITDDHKQAIKMIMQNLVPQTGEMDLIEDSGVGSKLTGPHLARKALSMLLRLSGWPEIAADLMENDFDVLLIQLLPTSKEFEDDDIRFEGQISIIPQILERVCNWEKVADQGGIDHMFKLAQDNGSQKKCLVPIQQALIMAYKNGAMSDEGVAHLIRQTAKGILKCWNYVPKPTFQDDKYLNPLVEALFQTLYEIEDPDQMAVLLDTPFFGEIIPFRQWNGNRTPLIRQRLLELIRHMGDINPEISEYLLQEHGLLDLLFTTLSWELSGTKVVEDITCIFQLLCQVMQSEYSRSLLLGRVPDKKLKGARALLDVRMENLPYTTKIGLFHFVSTLVMFYEDDDMADYIEQYDIAEYVSEMMSDNEDTVRVILNMCIFLVRMRDHVRPTLGKVLSFLFSSDGEIALMEIAEGEDAELAELAEVLMDEIRQAEEL